MEQVHVRRAHTLHKKRTQMGSVTFKHPAEARISPSGLSPVEWLFKSDRSSTLTLERARAPSKALLGLAVKSNNDASATKSAEWRTAH
jgi:hypothetical protein